jgi:hypothetical protein
LVTRGSGEREEGGRVDQRGGEEVSGERGAEEARGALLGDGLEGGEGGGERAPGALCEALGVLEEGEGAEVEPEVAQGVSGGAEGGGAAEGGQGGAGLGGGVPGEEEALGVGLCVVGEEDEALARGPGVVGLEGRVEGIGEVFGGGGGVVVAQEEGVEAAAVEGAGAVAEGERAGGLAVAAALGQEGLKGGVGLGWEGPEEAAALSGEPVREGLERLEGELAGERRGRWRRWRLVGPEVVVEGVAVLVEGEGEPGGGGCAAPAAGAWGVEEEGGGGKARPGVGGGGERGGGEEGGRRGREPGEEGGVAVGRGGGVGGAGQREGAQGVEVVGEGREGGVPALIAPDGEEEPGEAEGCRGAGGRWWGGGAGRGGCGGGEGGVGVGGGEVAGEALHGASEGVEVELVLAAQVVEDALSGGLLAGVPLADDELEVGDGRAVFAGAGGLFDEQGRAPLHITIERSLTPSMTASMAKAYH